MSNYIYLNLIDFACIKVVSCFIDMIVHFCSISNIAEYKILFFHLLQMQKVSNVPQKVSSLYFQAAPVSSAPTEGELLSEMCDNFLRGLITSCQLLVYTITTECDRRHGYTTARRRGYAESLCQQVFSDLVELIDSLNVSETSKDFHLGDSLAREQAEQEELCTILSRFYDVIRPEEEEVRIFSKGLPMKKIKSVDMISFVP